MMRRTLCLSALLLVGACASGYSDGAADPSMPHRPDSAIEGAAPPSPAGTAPIGVASWYGPRHQGRPIAGGARYDMGAFTAAHPSLPMGTRLRVVDTGTGRSVTVTVTDRGPYVAGRVLDLSRSAARELGMLRAGLAMVALQLLPPDEVRLSVAPPSRRTVSKPVHPAGNAPADVQGTPPSPPLLDARIDAGVNAEVADRSIMVEEQVQSTRARPSRTRP